jgi:hypothetical protein
MPGTLSIPEVSQQPYSPIRAQTVPTELSLSPTGGRVGGPELGENDDDDDEQEAPQRSPLSRAVTVGLVIYVAYRLLA